MMKSKRPSNIVFLCGLKSCGKSTIAKEIAERIGCIWIDCDQEILKRNPSFENCKSLYSAIGEKAFRQEEISAFNSIIEKIQKKDSSLSISVLSVYNTPVVISLGGGACNANNVLNAAKNNGLLVYLYETEHNLFERMSKNGLPAYLTNSKNPKEEFHTIFEIRNEIYSSLADYVIQLSDFPKDNLMHNVANKVIELMQQKLQ